MSESLRSRFANEGLVFAISFTSNLVTLSVIFPGAHNNNNRF